MGDYPKFDYKMFESNNGSIYSKMKMLGENNVPLGCYYDPGEKYIAFKERLNDSIFTALNQIEEALQKAFSIGKNDIIYEACVNRQWTKNIQLSQVQALINQHIVNYGDDDFQVQIIVNCKKQINLNDVQIWGTVIDIGYWEDKWYDELEDENYPVWLISIEGIDTTLDEPFGKVKLERIKTWIINQTKKEFNKYYGKSQN